MSVSRCPVLPRAFPAVLAAAADQVMPDLNPSTQMPGAVAPSPSGSGDLCRRHPHIRSPHPPCADPTPRPHPRTPFEGSADSPRGGVPTSVRGSDERLSRSFRAGFGGHSGDHSGVQPGTRPRNQLGRRLSAPPGTRQTDFITARRRRCGHSAGGPYCPPDGTRTRAAPPRSYSNRSASIGSSRDAFQAG